MSDITNYPGNYSVSSENNVDNNLSTLTDKHIETVTQETIRLLEERLVVDSKKHKVGEVVVRKVVETRIIDVPVRREKLVIEQVHPRYKKLGEISLGDIEINQPEITNGKSDIKAEFTSPAEAIQFINKLVKLKPEYETSKIKIIISNS